MVRRRRWGNDNLAKSKWGNTLVLSDRIRPVAGRTRLRRWMTAALVVTLLGLTAAAVLGSWRQATIVRTIAADSMVTDAYQRSAYLAARELALLRALLRDPDGEERQLADDANARTVAALEALAAQRDERSAYHRDLVVRQVELEPDVETYLQLLDQGDLQTAGEVLDKRIEPAAEAIMESLRREQDEQVAAYVANLDAAARDSRLLQMGTLLAFLLGLAVLAVVGWSSRTQQRLIERMAAHDAMTGLFNRRAFHSRVQVALAEPGHRPTVLVLDLDGFKEVNDSLGHHTGDHLLIEVGKRLRGCVRGGDTVARLGGDEFAVLFADTDPGIGESAAARIVQAINTPFVVDGLTLDIEVSIGIATAEEGEDVATVIRHADTAMYLAKEHRLGYTRFEPSQAHDVTARFNLLGDLRRALDAENELQLHYQPKVSVDTGELIGAEALARWQHPTRGPISPVEFIPVLEGTSLVHRFTAHVLNLALAQARVWLDGGDRVPVAVNVSARCLLDTEFPNLVAQALNRAGLTGDHLCIEITENTVMADPARAIEVLRRVRALGVRTAIDDFGTGYSSMAYLKILPVDEIKVDRSFVRDMASDRNNYALVEAAVDLGHNLGLSVVAEGVEDDSTVASLTEVGCDIAQGYHYARPLPPAEFAKYLAAHPTKRQITA